ncbi:STAS domain-containing protein [Amycolatopsis sp. NPDC051102]|uniref:STAS domain-containing protein n=1 Tax=Amycolatopsis sp. NPDC051102 TaxID=3155163 RepID=UPI0034469D0F
MTVHHGQSAAGEPIVPSVVIDFPRPRPLPPHRYQDLTITVERFCGTLVVAVDGEVDLCTAPMLHDVLEASLSLLPQRIVVDLSLVRFLNTAGLQVLLDAHRGATPGTEVRLVATTRATLRPLRLTRADERLVVHTSRAAAIAAPRWAAADTG